jgi:1-acyl-sn-glycerol-3-phosphate acyltransferase
MKLVRWLSVNLLRLAARLLLRVKTAGLGQLPSQGPVMLVVNHINAVEPLLLYVSLPRPVIALAKVEIWGNLFTRLVAESWDSIPIRRGEMDMLAVRRALQVVHEGGALGLAPEGTRSHHGRLQRGRPGIALLALRATGTPILPVAVYGQERFFDNVRHLRRTDVNVVMGQPFYLEAGEARVTHEVRQAISDEIMLQIAALMPPDYRGVYSDWPPTQRYLRFPAETGASGAGDRP